MWGDIQTYRHTPRQTYKQTHTHTHTHTHTPTHTHTHAHTHTSTHTHTHTHTHLTPSTCERRRAAILEAATPNNMVCSEWNRASHTNLQRVTRCTSHITRNTSHVTHHPSPFTHRLSNMPANELSAALACTSSTFDITCSLRPVAHRGYVATPNIITVNPLYLWRPW